MVEGQGAVRVVVVIDDDVLDIGWFRVYVLGYIVLN